MTLPRKAGCGCEACTGRRGLCPVCFDPGCPHAQYHGYMCRRQAEELHRHPGRVRASDTSILNYLRGDSHVG